MLKKLFILKSLYASLFAMILSAPVFAGEASLIVPNIKTENPESYMLLLIGLGVSILGVLFGLWMFREVKKVEVHEAMNSVGNTIFETCKTYLVQQGKFLLALEILIGLCIAFYFCYRITFYIIIFI